MAIVTLTNFLEDDPDLWVTSIAACKSFNNFDKAKTLSACIAAFETINQNIKEKTQHQRHQKQQLYQPSYHYQSSQQQYEPPQQKYQPLQQRYQPPQQKYQPLQQRYQPPQQKYQPLQQRYQPPQQKYQPLQQRYQPPQQKYQPLQQRYQPPQQKYQPLQQRYQPPQQKYQPPPHHYQPPPHHYQPQKHEQQNYQNSRGPQRKKQGPCQGCGCFFVRKMWPMLLDMSRDESKRILRRLELESYCNIVSTFRAQGDLTKEKKKILQDLQQSLSISNERHRAEVRRAINDEKLSTIADHMAGPSTESEWLIEGRRLIPLMPRLVPQTAFTATANHVANMQAEKNATMPSPSQTASKEQPANIVSSPTTPVGGGPMTKLSRPPSPNSNVVVLPSGMSIHIKGGLNTEEDEDTPGRKRRRSQSTETVMSPTASTQTPRVSYTSTAANTVGGVSPMKITISKSPQGRSQVSTTQSQKVILVSSSGQSSSPSILQKSITVPVVKTTGSISNVSGQNKASIILPNSTAASSNGNLGNIVTVATPTMSTATTSNTTPTVVTTSTMTFLTPAISKMRQKTPIPRQRFTQVSQGQQKPGVVIPMGPQPVQPSPQSVQNIHIKPVSKAIQIRQEGGMKIITQSVPGGTSKILPKPTQLSTSSGTPVVVVSAGSVSTSSVNMVTRPVTSVGQSGTKILNITQGGKVISNRTANVVTVNPKTLHLTAVKSPAGGSGKPNVIVVQKSLPRRSGTPTGKGTTVISSPFEKELVSFLQKQDSTKHIVVTTPSGGQRTVERKVIVTTPGQLDAASRQRARSESEGGNKTTSLLADLIHAAGIAPDHAPEGDVTINLDEAAIAALNVSSQPADTQTTSKGATTQALPNNEWFEYDDSQNYQSPGVETTPMQSLIDLPGGSKPKVTVQRSASVDLSQLSDQLSQQQFYTIEQAMNILNQPDRGEATQTSTDPVSLLQMQAQEPDQQTSESQSQSSVTTEATDTDTIPSLQSSSQGSTEASHSEMEQISHSLGFQGELDPQTGLFYTVAGSEGRSQASVVTAVQPSLETTSSAASKAFDLLSSSLAQAQIDLDPFQFIEEDVLVEKNNAPVPDTIIGSEAQEIQQESSTTPNIMDKVVVLGGGQEETVESSESNNTVRVKPSSFIPIQDLNKSGQTSIINITQHSQPNEPSTVAEMVLPQSSVFPSDAGVEVVSSGDNLGEVTLSIEGGLDGQITESLTAVSVETSHMVDPMDVRGDITSLEDMGVVSSPSTGTGNSSDSQGDSGLSLDASNALRLSKRKRKPPSSIEDSPTPGGGCGTTTGGAWIRSCIGLIQRVSRYRGLNREKGDLNAASWFTEPVDPAEVPDYYSIIKNPMDFGTIKKKLEIGTNYNDHEDFHSDMLLVRDNCRLYNPPGSTVRRDCDEVFAFYMSEYEKLLEKWQKAHISSPASKKLKFENKSPVRT